MDDHDNDITRVLSRAEADQSQASEELLPLVYEELLRLAAARMARESAGHTLQATALVNLQSSPTLGAGAVWTTVTGSLSVAGGNYQMTVPTAGVSAFYRLTQ